MLGYLTKGLVNSCVVLLMVSAGFVSAQNQTVSAVVSLTEILPGETTSLSITYNVSASSTDGLLTSGLGLRLHYDSTSVYCDESVISDLLADSSIGMQLMNDTDDKDTDASTDKYLNTAWANINGAWPSTASLPATLYTLNCTALSGFTGTTLKFSTSSTASGYDFIASDIVLTERLLPTDTTAPVITLLGDAQVTVDLDGTYSDSGAVADTGETIILSGFVDTSTIGTYTLTYSATDDAGNQADAVTRTVIVENTDTGGGH